MLCCFLMTTTTPPSTIKKPYHHYCCILTCIFYHDIMHYCCVNSHLMHYQLLQFLRFSHYDWFKVCMRSGSVRLSFKEGTSGVVVVAAATRINIRKAQRCAKRFPSSFLLGWMNFKRNNFNKKNLYAK